MGLWTKWQDSNEVDLMANGHDYASNPWTPTQKADIDKTSASSYLLYQYYTMTWPQHMNKETIQSDPLVTTETD